MKTHYEEYTRQLNAAILDSPGTLSSTLRHAVRVRAASLGGRAGQDAAEVPAELTNYVRKVAFYAYRVTDEDIEALLNAGYSEDALFEITLSAALGAGMERLECGLNALKGNENAPQDR